MRNTGEIYAVQLGNREAPLYVLGVVRPDHVDDDDRHSLFYATLEHVLRGWGDQCAQPNSLPWVVESLNRYGNYVQDDPTLKSSPKDCRRTLP